MPNKEVFLQSLKYTYENDTYMNDEIKSGNIVSIPIKKKQGGAFPNESYITTTVDGNTLSGFVANDYIVDDGQNIVGIVVNLEDDKVFIKFSGELNRSTTAVSKEWFKKEGKIIE